MSDLVIVHTVDTSAEGVDRLYVHGAVIEDPANNPNALLDEDGESWVFVVPVPSSQSHVPHDQALEKLGITVVGTTASGDWIGVQLMALGAERP